MAERKLNLVLEGGGVKGIGLVGAVEKLESAGYSWKYLAGTSAGAIVATLLAVGYKGEDLWEKMGSIDFSDMMDDENIKKVFLRVINTKGWLKIFRPFAIFKLYRKLKKDYGLFRGDYVEDLVDGWIEEKKGKRGYTFGDLQDEYGYASRLSLMVTDITEKRLFVLPHDAEKLHLNPRQMTLTSAMRMSMSFPFFFTPVQCGDDWVMDGGVLSNFPYWFVQDLQRNFKANERYPTVGLLLDEPPSDITSGIWSIVTALLSTMISSLDQAFSVYNERVIRINVAGVSTLDFSLSDDLKRLLYRNGQAAASNFLAGSFRDYKAQQKMNLSKNFNVPISQ